MAKNSTALAVVQEFQVPAINEELGRAFSEEMNGLQVDFDRVKIPSGGGLAFEVPGDDPDNPDTEKELIGVILDHYPVNAYWADKYSGQNNPPDCSSLDGKTGINRDGEKISCATCPHNQWGSDPESGGKQCKNMHRIYLLREGEMFPLLLTLPPTSIKNFASYIAKRVLAKGRRSFEVITKVFLKKAVNAGGITYSQANFAVVGMLAPEKAKEMGKYASYIRPMTRMVEIVTDESEAVAREPGEDDNWPPASDGILF